MDPDPEEENHQCGKCGKTYAHERSLKRHLETSRKCVQKVEENKILTRADTEPSKQCKDDKDHVPLQLRKDERMSSLINGLHHCEYVK